MTKTWGPFTGRQLTTIVGFLCAAVVLLPGAAWAVDAFSNVAIEDPVSGSKASVDRSNRLQVGDATGPLTVDGTVGANALPTKSSKYFAVHFGTANTSGTVHTNAAGFAVTSITLASFSTAKQNASFFIRTACQTTSTILELVVPAGQTVQLPFPQVLNVPSLGSCSNHATITWASSNVALTVLGYDY